MTVFAFAQQQEPAQALATELGTACSIVECHRFPDGESCIQIEPELIADSCVVYASLVQPDNITLPLFFLAHTLRDYGVQHITLVAPYLAYMRQDKIFKSGQGVTARYYARLLSSCFDKLVTVDPHLHRIHDLADIYSIETKLVRAAPAVSNWLKANVSSPVIIGPDSESAQWVKKLAKNSGAPFLVLEKTRRGDRDVEVIVPQVEKWTDCTPVLFDDIISTGKTMIETIKHLLAAGLSAPVCIGIHAVFADAAWQQIKQA
ncbi:MAG: ribose-phosphate diphosphokinase, partial [Gammaproteobacteria bacterium]